MTKTSPKKLSLSTSTIRNLSGNELAGVAGGTSVGTCTGCQFTWNPTDRTCITCKSTCTQPPKTIVEV
jgi:hypothetical protein